MTMDLLTDLPETPAGFDSLLVAVDHGSTKAIVLMPTTKTVGQVGIATLLQDNVFRRFGLPSIIVSD